MFGKGRARHQEIKLPCLHEQVDFLISGERSDRENLKDFRGALPFPKRKERGSFPKGQQCGNYEEVYYERKTG